MSKGRSYTSSHSVLFSGHQESIAIAAGTLLLYRKTFCDTQNHKSVELQLIRNLGQPQLFRNDVRCLLANAHGSIRRVGAHITRAYREICHELARKSASASIHPPGGLASDPAPITRNTQTHRQSSAQRRHRHSTPDPRPPPPPSAPSCTCPCYATSC